MNSTECIDCSITQHDSGVEISWSDGVVGFYHHVWLRDCCYCELCGDSYSSNRFLHPNNVPLDIKPAHLDITDSGNLEIVWRDDDHKSSYETSWLRQYGYSEKLRELRFHQPKFWDAKINQAIPAVEYSQSVNCDQTRMALLRYLRDYGFVVIRNGPSEDNGIEPVANLIGQIEQSAYGKFFDLSPKSSHKTAGNTMFPVPPHTDEAFRGNPPGINVLHCVRPAKSGGESILVDGFNLGQILRHSDPDQFELLVKQPQSYHRVVRDSNIDQRARAPVFTLDENETIVGFRFHPRSAAPMDTPRDLFLSVYAANRHLCELMFDERNQARFKLDAGDAVMFDNHRVMHARAAFDDENRKLRICSVSREQFHEQLRLLAYKLGFIDESQQILSVGVGG